MRFRTPMWGAMVVCLCACALASPAGATTIAVPAGGDLQAAIDAAVPGDVITLAPGATFVGNFVLPNKGDADAFITIRSAAPDSSLPPDGVRITPAYASFLPKIYSPNSMSSLRTRTGTNHWKLMFLEFQANYKGYGEIISLGAGDDSQTDLAQVPHDLVVDRVYVHGDPTMGQKRGIALHSRDTVIVNSYISDIKAVGQDTQAISGFNGPGNYLIENNYLEAATENFLLGGADPTIPNLVTTNVTFRRNYLRKPLEWRSPIIAPPADVHATPAPGAGSLGAGTYYYKVVARVAAGQTTKANSSAVEVSSTIAAGTTGGVTVTWTPVAGADDYVVYGRAAGAENVYWKTTDPYFTDTGAAGTSGGPHSATKWAVKNLFELKNAQDVLVEGNVFENLWVADQPGYPIVFTPRNQSGTAPWSVVQRVTFRNNLVRHTAGGVNILGTDNINPSQLTNHITIANNVFDDVGSAWGTGSKVFQIGDGGDVIFIDHNTIDTNDSTIVSLYGGSKTNPTELTGFAYTNNMSEHRNYGIFGANMSSGNLTIATYLPSGIVTGNVLAGGSSSRYPAGNYFPTVTEWKSSFVDYNGGDYHVLPGYPWSDAGADIDALNAQIANALSGDDSLPPGANHVQITTTSVPNGVFNQPYAQSLACVGGTGPCAWQVVDASMPAGLTFDAVAGVLMGTPSTVQTGTLTVKAYDPAWPNNSATATLTITVDPPPFVVTMPTPPPAQAGVPFLLSPTASGALGSVTWTIVSGSLPDGLWLDAFSGAIAGTPTGWGTSTAVVQAQDSWRPDRVDAKSVAIEVAPSPLAVTTTTLGAAPYQQYYQAMLNTNGGTGVVTWSVVSGSLPNGVQADSSGSISGTPTTIGNYTLTVKAVDANWPGNQATATLALAVTPPAFSIAIAGSSAGQVGAPYQLAGSATGQVGAAVWSVLSGALPSGLLLDSATGVIAGIPAASGTYTAVLQAYDSWDASRVASAPVTIAIAPTALSVATSSLEDARAHHAYAASLAADGGTGLTSWSITSGALPAGLTLAANGVISGTPLAAGSATFTVQATDDGWAGNVAARTLSITIRSGDIVLYAADASVVRGTWSLVDDADAAAGKRMWNANAGAAKLTVPLATPANYFEITFNAEAGVAYHVWMRGKADRNYWGNDSVYVQFSGSVDASGEADNQIGTKSATTVTIEDGLNAGLSGWGWADNSYGGLGDPIYFATSGPQTIRVQVREDGLSLDQIVLSADTSATDAPGATKNDTTIVPR